MLAGSFSYASRVYRAQGMISYANTLQSAAESAWAWLQPLNDSAEPSVVRNLKLWAAAELFRNNASLTTARDYVDSFHSNQWANVWSLNHPLSFDTLAAFTYVPTTGPPRRSSPRCARPWPMGWTPS